MPMATRGESTIKPFLRVSTPNACHSGVSVYVCAWAESGNAQY